MNPPFGTVLTAMVTPMHADGALDLDGAAAPRPIPGRAATTAWCSPARRARRPRRIPPEKVDLLRAVREAVGPDVTILTGAGSNDTAHAVRMAEQGAENGADALLASRRTTRSPASRESSRTSAPIVGATELPVMLYDIPGRTGVAIGDDAIDTLAHVDSIVAVKDATGNVAPGEGAHRAYGARLVLGRRPPDLRLHARRGRRRRLRLVAHRQRGIAAMIAASEAGDDAAEAIHEETEPAVQAITGAGLGPSTPSPRCSWSGSSRAAHAPSARPDDAEYARLRPRSPPRPGGRMTR